MLTGREKYCHFKYIVLLDSNLLALFDIFQWIGRNFLSMFGILYEDIMGVEVSSVHDSKEQNLKKVKVKVGVLHPINQPGSYWDRFSTLSLVCLEPHRGDSL